jgi:hypothetical protein
MPRLLHLRAEGNDPVNRSFTPIDNAREVVFRIDKQEEVVTDQFHLISGLLSSHDRAFVDDRQFDTVFRTVSSTGILSGDFHLEGLRSLGERENLVGFFIDMVSDAIGEDYSVCCERDIPVTLLHR